MTESMDVELELFGSLCDLEPGGRLRLTTSVGRVADLREALVRHAAANWPQLPPGLLGQCAFATTSTVLRDAEALPGDGRMVVLPPVSGG